MQPLDRIDDPVRLRRLVQAILILDAELHLPVVLRRIIEEGCDLVDAQYGALGVLTEDGRALDQFVTVGLSNEEEQAIGPRPTGRGVLGTLDRGRQAPPHGQDRPTARTASARRHIIPP